MVKKSISLSCLILFVVSFVNAQFPRFSPPISENNNPFRHALVGGLIAPEFSAVDLNNDGIQDLYVFDKAGCVHLTFINQGTNDEVDYVYNPHYEQFFPVIVDWALQNSTWVMLRDYNGDGVMDYFSHSDVPGIDGFIVYTGKYVADALTFERFNFNQTANNVIPVFISGGFTNLFVTSQDYPSIDDIDGDGDLDILTFAVGGGHVHYYQNQSVEMGYGLDSLIYDLEDDCWGRFYESGISEVIELSSDINVCSNGFHDPDPNSDARHVGSTLLTFDNDADGDKELVLGDVSFYNLNMLINEAESGIDFMTAQDTFFPGYNVSAEIVTFPASFYLDINNDGVRDLLASPNVWKQGENHDVVWRYQNIGTDDAPIFQFVEKDFLVDEMIDMGREAHPAFVDYNADGLMDMVVGNGFFFQPFGNRAMRLYLFENVGNADFPAYELVDDDYLNFSIFDSTPNNLPAPTFGDLDNDGDMDVLIGEEGGGFFYGENVAGAGNTISIPTLQFGFMGLDLGVRSIPHFVDLNRDGLLDIVAGEKAGRLIYFQNEGTAEEPMFIPNIDTNTPAGNNIIGLGFVDTRLGFTSGYSAPYFYDLDGEYTLVVGTERGNIMKYGNIDGNLDGAFVLEDSLWGDLRPGFRTVPVLIDLNNNNRLDLVVGNVRGGLTMYKTNINTDGTPVSTSNPVINTNAFLVFPNPTGDILNLSAENMIESNLEITVYNNLGQIVDRRIEGSGVSDYSFSTNSWGKGLFVVQLKYGNTVQVEKVIVK